MSPPAAIPSLPARTSSAFRLGAVLPGVEWGPVTFELVPIAEPMMLPPATTDPRPPRTRRPVAGPPLVLRNRAITDTSKPTNATTAPTSPTVCSVVSGSAKTATRASPTLARPVTAAVTDTHTRAVPVIATSSPIFRQRSFCPEAQECPQRPSDETVAATCKVKYLNQVAADEAAVCALADSDSGGGETAAAIPERASRTGAQRLPSKP